MESPYLISDSPVMADPLSEVVTLLQPGAAFSKLVSGAGRWRVRRTEPGRPFYCVVLEGSCRLAVEGREPLMLQADDFVLIPAAHHFTNSSLDPPDDGRDDAPTLLPSGEFRLGTVAGPPQVRMMVGYCVFGSPDAAMLVSQIGR